MALPEATSSFILVDRAGGPITQPDAELRHLVLAWSNGSPFLAGLPREPQAASAAARPRSGAAGLPDERGSRLRPLLEGPPGGPVDWERALRGSAPPTGAPGPLAPPAALRPLFPN
jgi:hypothetical protein